MIHFVRWNKEKTGIKGFFLQQNRVTCSEFKSDDLWCTNPMLSLLRRTFEGLLLMHQLTFRTKKIKLKSIAHDLIKS